MAASRMGRVHTRPVRHPPRPAAPAKSPRPVAGRAAWHQCCSAHAFPCGVAGQGPVPRRRVPALPARCCRVPAAAAGPADQLLQGPGQPAAPSGMGRGQHCAQAVGSDRLGMQVGHRNAVFQQGKVELIFTQRIGQNTAVGHLGLQLNAGVERCKAAASTGRMVLPSVTVAPTRTTPRESQSRMAASIWSKVSNR